jgi:hypothetical protein
MYELTPERFGRFDIVLFMGVLYHLKHPLLSLERVCALTTGMAAVDSFILRDQQRKGDLLARRPVMEFYETSEMGGQTDNWVAPSLECLLAFCRTAGFARVELQNVIQHSACIACYREWKPPAANAKPGPELTDTTHNLNPGINFETHRDDYVSIWFNWPTRKLTLDDVRPQVGDFGVRPIHLAPEGKGGWMANFKLPPGLSPGWHNVTVRAGDSAPSNALQVAVDVPLVCGELELRSLADGDTWVPNQLDLGQGRTVALWISGLPANADRHNVRVYLRGQRLNVAYIERRDDSEPRQVNAIIPDDCPTGIAHLGVAVGERRTNAVELRIFSGASG